MTDRTLDSIQIDDVKRAAVNTASDWLCIVVASRWDDVNDVAEALDKAERAAHPDQLPVVVWVSTPSCRSHDLVVLRWSDFLNCLGEAQPSRNYLLEELEERAALGDNVAQERLAVLAPDRLPCRPRLR